jgi:toxin ParE1/3/4
MRLRWAAPALRDLDALGDYIARDDPGAATRIVARIFEQTDQLAAHPHIGRPGRVPGTRELVVKDAPYIVPYRVRDGEVELLAVFHGARQWPEKFE